MREGRVVQASRVGGEQRGPPIPAVHSLPPPERVLQSSTVKRKKMEEEMKHMFGPTFCRQWSPLRLTTWGLYRQRGWG